MSDRIGTALARLNDRIAETAAVTMTYRRGAYSVSLSVTIGAVAVSPLTVLAGVVADRDLSQPSPKHVDHPFWFNAADLIINGSLVEPADGDTMERVISGTTYLYTLSAPYDGSQPWGYANGYESGDAARIRWNGRLKSVT